MVVVTHESTILKERGLRSVLNMLVIQFDTVTTERDKLRLLIYRIFGEEAVWVCPESLFVST